MKLNIIRGILITALIAIFVTIFGFSNQNAETSSGLSQKVANFVVEIVPSIKNMPEQEKEEVVGRIESIVRKIAHYSIYTLVGILLMSLMSTYKIKELDRIAVSLIIGVIYASTDEIHQAFVPGRGSLVTDVILDSMGVLSGICIVLLAYKVICKMCIHKYNNMT